MDHPGDESATGEMDDRSADAAETRLNRLLNLLLESAVEIVGFDAATVTARQGSEMSTVAATDQRLIDLDEAQYESGEGPCLDVLDQREPVIVADMADELRWGHFREVASQMGVASSLSVHVPSEQRDVATSLNFYGRAPRRLTEQQIRSAEGYAEQLAATIEGVDAYRAAAKLAHDLAEAMRSRAVIEQAKGMLMAESRVDADGAFELLRGRSQHENVKLREIAQHIVFERSSGAGTDLHAPDEGDVSRG